jgi:hypothetical protein
MKNKLIFHLSSVLCLYFSLAQLIHGEPIIDAVITWVDSSDPDWQKQYSAHSLKKVEENRFKNNNELVFALRSIEKHAPYIRKVFIVTNGQVPNFLNLNNTRLEVVSHETIFQDKTDLPVFSANAIEVHLHRIPNISRYFIYINDDFFFNSDSKIEDFFDFEKKEYKLYFDSSHYMNGTFKTNIKDNKSVDQSNTRCTYSQALVYSNKLLDTSYGEFARPIPAHAPYPIDSVLMEEL